MSLSVVKGREQERAMGVFKLLLILSLFASVTVATIIGENHLAAASITEVGQKAILKCEVANQEAPDYEKVEWKFLAFEPKKADGDVICTGTGKAEDKCDDGYELVEPRENLAILKVTVGDEGSYSCTANKKDTDPEDPKTGRVAVVEGPITCVPPEDVTVEEEARFNCTMTVIGVPAGEEDKYKPTISCKTTMGETDLPNVCGKEEGTLANEEENTGRHVHNKELCITSEKVGEVKITCTATFPVDTAVLPASHTFPSAEAKYKVKEKTDGGANGLHVTWSLLLLSLLLAYLH